MTKAPRLSAPRKQRTTRSSALQPSLAPSSSTADLLSPNVDFENEEPDPDDLSYSPDKATTRSSSITPPPIIPLARNDKRSRAVTGDSDSDAVNEKPKKKSTKKAAEVVEPEDHRLVLMIPRAELDGSQRVLLSHATTFDEALTVIYETIGCTNVTVKPVLTYKLSNATKSAEVICLSSDNDWDGCLEQVAAAENPKRPPISVKINVTEQYLASLRAKLNIKVSGTRTKTGRGKTKMQILDLEHAGSGDDDFNDGIGLMDKERKRLAELQAKYSRCQLCGPDKACKIDVNGNHCKLSNNQIRAWFAALALETHGVTLATPPDDTLFGMFFKNSKSNPASSTAPASFPFPPYMPMNPMNPYGLMPWAMPGMPSFGIPASPVTPTPNPQIARASGSNRRSPPIPSSDPPDMAAASVYPEITSFLRKLDQFHPKRDLLKYIPLFEELDFFNIDEIAKLETATALRGAMNISLGNATFLLEQVRGEMKRADRESSQSLLGYCLPSLPESIYPFTIQ
ncbi:hypothetical protein K438DRAFT_1931764 [Mycena galopus ATCC 62051]|nr:hypothetical protein K438DRAFT_1931764 [Mycena galopus ATCC 62051]